MPIRPLAVLLPLALLAQPAPVAHAPGPQPDRYLRGSQCLDPGMARGFVRLDDYSLLVDAGRNRYRIQLPRSCWNFGLTNVIGFRGEPVGNRVCGGAFDAVLVRDNAPCRIERIELLDKETYKQLMNEHDATRRKQPGKSGVS